MSWNIKTPGDYINGPLTVAGSATITGALTVDATTLVVDPTNDRVGIRQATPSFTLDVNGAGNVVCARISSGSGTGFRFDTTRNISGLNRNYLIGPDIVNEGWFSIIPSTALGGGTFTNSIYNASSDGIHAWSNGAGNELMRLNTTGNLVLKGGTAGANGVGLTFPATPVASSDANCLDDYEEGTWVPVPTAGTGSFTSVTGAAGTYTKIGRMVTATAFFKILVNGGGGSFIQVAGLPFALGSMNNIGVGRVDATTGEMFQIKLNAFTAVGNIWTYNNSYPGADGAEFPMTLVYFV